VRTPKIPKPTVRRLAIYYRCLTKLKDNSIDKTSSKEMADLLGIKASQVRKDLSYFGEFGKRGVGYNVDKLSFKLKEILGLKKNWNVAIVGAGNLGSAIANYAGIEKNGFKIISAFDVDEKKVGQMIVPGVTIQKLDEIEDRIKKNHIEIAILTVPVNAAQEVTDKLINCGIKGILNFTPTSISTPEDVSVEDVDFVISLKSLTFEIASSENEL
jgi:redox-sensing transcriptional repressor